MGYSVWGVSSCLRHKAATEHKVWRKESSSEPYGLEFHTTEWLRRDGLLYCCNCDVLLCGETVRFLCDKTIRIVCLLAKGHEGEHDNPHVSEWTQRAPAPTREKGERP